MKTYMPKKTTNKALKYFMKSHFDFSTLKKVGFYPKDMKHNDYEGQAARVCYFFGYKSVYEYGKNEIRCHISYPRTIEVDSTGEMKCDPFVTVLFPNSLHI